jgi:dihydroflavonol-4-reductase
MRALHVEGTRNVMQAAAANGIKRVIYASTSGTIGCSASPHDVATEATPFPEAHISKWPYYATKLEAEKVAFEQAQSLGLALTSVHPSLLLGPGDLRNSSTEDIIRILKKQVPAIPSGGLNFVDVRDVAHATANALEKGAPGERYLLGNVNWSLKEFIHRVGREGGVKVPRLPAPDLLTRWTAYMTEPLFRSLNKTPPLDGVSAEMSQYFWYFDSSKAQSELGFRPRNPEETLRDTIEDLRARGVAP